MHHRYTNGRIRDGVRQLYVRLVTSQRNRLGLALGTISLAVLLLVGCATANDDATPTQSDTTTSATSANGDAQSDTYWDMVLSQFPDAERPSVAPIRYISIGESASLLTECMHDAGWPEVVATTDGGVESGAIPAGQEEAYAVAFYTCQVSYPLDPKYSEPLTQEQLSSLYRYLVDDQMLCLQTFGYEVSPPSSEQAFIEKYSSGDAWDPYSDVVPLVKSQEEWDTLVTTCPQLPENLFG